MGFFWDEGREPSWSKQSNYTPGQQKLLGGDIKQARQLQQGGYGDAMSLLQQFLDPQSDAYRNFEAPYMQQFEQQILPGIAERFAGMNAMGGGLSSSGFGQALGAAGSNLQTQLAQMKEQYRRQSINDLMNQYNQVANRGLGARSFENVYDPGTQGQMGIGGNILNAAATGAGYAFGGPLGGAAAKGASGLFNDWFNSGNQSQSLSAGGLSSQGNFNPYTSGGY